MLRRLWLAYDWIAYLLLFDFSSFWWAQLGQSLRLAAWIWGWDAWLVAVNDLDAYGYARPAGIAFGCALANLAVRAHLIKLDELAAHERERT